MNRVIGSSRKWILLHSNRQQQGVKVAQVSSSPAKAEDMDKEKKQEENSTKETGNIMSHSFGEGYSTRADEEGFGGTYGGNIADSNVHDDTEIHENHPAYDKSQGSEVSEKERGRHQTKAS